MGTVARWLSIGVIPQLTLWMAVTTVLGVLVAVSAAALVGPRARQPAAA
jgi:hypothetical protein